MDQPIESVDFLIPAWNESENLPELFEQLQALSRLKHFSKAIVVDDGSADGSPLLMQRYAQRASWWQVIQLPKHVGKCAALQRALLESQATYVVQLDSDCQISVVDAIGLLAYAKPNVGAVLARRTNRKDTRLKTWFSRLGNAFGNRAFGASFMDVNSSARLFRREALLAVPYFRENHRYLPYFIKRLGYDVVEVHAPHHPRRHGESRYKYLGRTKAALISGPRCLKELRRFPKPTQGY